jgi:hypothetical protein
LERTSTWHVLLCNAAADPCVPSWPLCLQAIRLATTLSERTPDLVHLLLPLQMEDELRTGYATALTSALLRLQNVDAAEGNAGADPTLGNGEMHSVHGGNMA